MKTKTLLAFSILLSIGITFSCKPKETETETCTTGDKKQYKIPVKDILNMVDKYRKERQEIINSNPVLQAEYGAGFEDSRCIWFSIEDLRAFVDQVEKEVKENKLDVKFDGLRMYYTVYPAKKDSESDYLQSIAVADRNHQALIMVPTYYDAVNKVSIDFDPKHINGNKPVHLKALKNSDSISTYQTALNHGALCPPKCPPPTGGAAATSFLNQ